MKKRFGSYLVCWGIVFVLYQTVALILYRFADVKSGPNFWVGYAAVDVALCGQLVCAYVAMREENLKKIFYRISMPVISYMGLAVTLLFGILHTLVYGIPVWVTLIVHIVIFGFTLIAVLAAKAAADEIGAKDEKIQNSTAFIKSLRGEAETLLAKAKRGGETAETVEACGRIYEAIRYSDPVSNEALLTVEVKIRETYSAFVAAIERKDAGEIAKTKETLLQLLNERNSRCRLMK